MNHSLVCLMRRDLLLVNSSISLHHCCNTLWQNCPIKLPPGCLLQVSHALVLMHFQTMELLCHTRCWCFQSAWSLSSFLAGLLHPNIVLQRGFSATVAAVVGSVEEEQETGTKQPGDMASSAKTDVLHQAAWIATLPSWRCEVAQWLTAPFLSKLQLLCVKFVLGDLTKRRDIVTGELFPAFMGYRQSIKELGLPWNTSTEHIKVHMHLLNI